MRQNDVQSKPQPIAQAQIQVILHAILDRDGNPIFKLVSLAIMQRLGIVLQPRLEVPAVADLADYVFHAPAARGPGCAIAPGPVAYAPVFLEARQ